MSGEFLCCMWWSLAALVGLLHDRAPPVSPHQLGCSSFCFLLLLLVKRKVWILQGKEMGSESWKTVNHVNSSVHKFCKALIIQDAASHSNYRNSMFLTLLLMKIFFIAVWFCCVEKELSPRNDSKSVYTILKRADIWNAKLLSANSSYLLKLNLWWLQTRMKNFSCRLKQVDCNGSVCFWCFVLFCFSFVLFYFE